MKRIFYNTLACCAALLALAACEKTEDLSDAGAGSGAILINFSSGDMTRAEEVTFDFENRVDHLDVLIFDDDETGGKELHERIQASSTNSGMVALTAKRNKFVENKKYWVYVIANANDAERTEFEKADFTKSDFLLLKREDMYIHLTGMPNKNSSGITLPQTFLMDGVAYDGDTEPMTLVDQENDKYRPLATSVVLNDGQTKDKLQLTVNLRRAAVKLVLNLIPGTRTDANGNVTGVKFLDPGTVSGAEGMGDITGGYYVRNMPYFTRLAAESTYEGSYSYNEDVRLRTPRRTRNHYFDVHSSGPDPEDEKKRLIDKITVTAYTYANNWATASSTMEREPRWIVDIPLQHITPGGGDRDVQTYQTCYYQVLVCKGQALERNTCYTVNATVYAPGGTDPLQPVTLTDIQYSVSDWIPEEISVGDDEKRPKFLTVNRTEMEMHETNVVTRETDGVSVRYAVDDTSVEFASSSKVTATVTRAYYIDKFGNEVEVSDAIRNAITLKPTADLNGYFTIESPVPVNNTARYIEVEIDNEDGMKRELTITQYAVINITNIQGYYSYRSDFGGTTWENYKNPTEKIVTAYGYSATGWKYSATDCGNQARKFDKDGKFDGWGDYLFFSSEVAEEIKPDEDDKRYVTINGTKYEIKEHDDINKTKYITIDKTEYEIGQSRISYYYYDYTKATWDSKKQDWIVGNELTKLLMPTTLNARMYHVEVTATSGDYTVGRPRITGGITDPGTDNAQLVSPSFLIASQLGTVRPIREDPIIKNLGEDLAKKMVADHCEQYVEVAKNGTVYEDWRLPTAAEIDIIIKLQYNTAEGAAMDMVMGGYKYYSASGLVYNKTVESDTRLHTYRYIRCVHDIYKTQDTGKSGTQEAGN